MPVQVLLDVSLLAVVTLAAIYDLARRRIPNRLLLVAWAVLLPLRMAGGEVADALAGAACGLLLFLPLYLLRGMAAGDVKLLATVGAFTGAAVAFQIGILSWCVGGVMALLMIIVRGQVRAVLANLRDLLRPLLMRLVGIPAVSVPMSRPSVGNMPFGLAIAVATIAFLWGRYP